VVVGLADKYEGGQIIDGYGMSSGIDEA